MDRFTSLSVFVHAVERGSLAAASRALGMTPAMAGKHLAALEASLGARLLHRTTRKLHLTEAGQDYYARGRHILESIDEADRRARDLQSEPQGLLRISAPSTFGALHLGAPVAQYMRRYPGVSVQMQLDDGFVDLVEGGFDMAIRIGQLPDSSLIARRLGETRMLACAAPDYLDARGRPNTPEALAALDRLAFSRATSSGDWSFTDTNGRVHHIEQPARCQVDDMQMLLAAALAGAGIVYGPDFVLGEHVASGRLEQVLTNFTTQSLGIHAVYPSARLLSAKLRLFIEGLERWLSACQRTWRGTPS
ncbi:LysR family transcriptional regulator [Oleiagrimonas sp. C23AA]|uniref:LysR family transcriptional regulator n=1 Tax=Oleiagrimonas sp. C23AA TaxID=2719047 RepID=UPI0014235E42|nr:LysR family transcriptional regulator [Oleiagrimonas sp. C23AA]NII10798.1 LysR family transcriptional regulator [Oleiagrimonas sp. C23AA]